jgi:L-asparaginase II
VRRLLERAGASEDDLECGAQDGRGPDRRRHNCSGKAAIDGCGVVTFALSLRQMAQSFARLAELDGAARVLAAMTGRPELIGGEGALDTALMRARPGWVAKRGAEGLLCARAPDGLGVALKVEDGNPRASSRSSRC